MNPSMREDLRKAIKKNGYAVFGLQDYSFTVGLTGSHQMEVLCLADMNTSIFDKIVKHGLKERVVRTGEVFTVETIMNRKLNKCVRFRFVPVREDLVSDVVTFHLPLVVDYFKDKSPKDLFILQVTDAGDRFPNEEGYSYIDQDIFKHLVQRRIKLSKDNNVFSHAAYKPEDTL